MKFLTKINQRYLLTFSLLLVIISVVGFFVLRFVLISGIKEDIHDKERMIEKEIKNNNLPNLYPIIETRQISEQQIIEESFKKIFIKDVVDDGEEEPFIEYTNTIIVENKHYLIILRHSLYEYEELMKAISIPLLLLIVLSFFVSYITSRKFNKTIWKDFEKNLEEIKNFSFEKPGAINLKATQIEEFDQLNKTVETLTEKLQNDYQSLKKFTENASHEIQTPISIISLNLEELLQQNISEKAMELVVKTRKVLTRLSDLNSKLLLLTKIDNRQFVDQKEMVINKLVQEKLDEFSPLITSKNIKVGFKNDELLKLKMNEELAGILINNLLANAIQHNNSNGKIAIEISKTSLKICNSGLNNDLTNNTIFNRFTKNNSQSLGLGLAIVKQICDTHKFKIQYLKNNLHCFILTKDSEL